tara:strand:+ start:493 stop:1470 length:978 start_codon:yes stop_codon:yes gene_type:complete
MKVLVLGYSVTAEGPGFVEIARDDIEAGSDIQLVKAGLGGVQPHHARYLFPEILRHHQPDAVVLDQSTPAYRTFLKSPHEYIKTLHALLRDIQLSGLRFGFLDLPRTDVDFGDDWVVRLHAALAEECDVPHIVVSRAEGLLRDEVHPTEKGRQVYATALLSLLDRLAPLNCTADRFEAAPHYDALMVTRLVPEHMPRYLLSRGGYDEKMVLVGSNLTLTLPFERPCIVQGFSGLMWPRSGAFEISLGGRTFQHQMYNEFCYYPRMGAVLFGGPNAIESYNSSWMSFRQLPEQPNTPLRKGTVNEMPRLGAVGSIFIEHKIGDLRG